jgi:F0F1-type ATP synthase assembly protein I
MAQPGWKQAYRFGNIGIEMFLSIVLGFWLGRYLDRRFFGAHGYGTAVGTIVGVYTGFRALYKLAMQAQREAEEDDERDRVQADKDAKVERYKRAIEKDEE